MFLVLVFYQIVVGSIKLIKPHKNRKESNKNKLNTARKEKMQEVEDDMSEKAPQCVRKKL